MIPEVLAQPTTRCREAPALSMSPTSFLGQRTRVPILEKASVRLVWRGYQVGGPVACFVGDGLLSFDVDFDFEPIKRKHRP